MVRYVKCPRCELNYIDAEKQEYCDVCIAEMKGNKLQFADLDDDDYEELELELDSESEPTELCPVCGVNKIRAGEKMCEACKKEDEYEEEEEVDIEKDEEWKNYLDDEEGGDLTIDDETLQEELDAELEDEEENSEEESDEDDFFEDVDSLSDLEDDDYDDDEDEEEEDEDDDF